MNPALQGYLAAMEENLASSAGLAEVASELRAVADVVNSSPDLTLALDDATVPVRARRAVLDTLLSGKVKSQTQRLVHQAVTTVPAAEVTTSFTWMAARLELDDDRGDAVNSSDAVSALGLLGSRTRVSGYAACVFESVPVTELEEIEDQLFRFTRTVETNRNLRSALSDRDLPVSVRQGVVDDLLGAKVLPSTLRLVKYAVRGGRARDIVTTLDRLIDDAAAARGWRVARVQSASEVSEEQLQQLTDALAALAGHPVDLQITKDAALLGGVVVQVGDVLIDGSTRHRLNALTQHLRSSEEAYQVTPDASPEGRTPTDG